MTKLYLILSTTAILMMMGCVSTKKYQSLETENKSLQAKNDAISLDNINCQNSLASVNAQVAGLRDQLNAERSNLQSLQSALDKCLTSSGQGNVNISKLVDEINASNKYIQALVASKNKSDSLNMVLTNNLTKSLSKEEMQALAKHFSEQPWPATSFPSDDAAARKAQSAMTAGACTSCHLGDLHGKSAIPRIADQQPVYLEKTILELKNNVRQNAPAKTALFSTYPDDELKALAVYLSSR